MCKGLEALERIKTLSEARGMLNYPEIIMKFGLIEEELKALEIIKEKQVNVEIFIEVIKQFKLRLNPNEKISLWKITEKEEHKKEKFITELELYNRTCMYGLSHLTQEEFDLLKEVLL